MYFTAEALKTISQDYQSVTGKHAKLMQAFVGRDYKEARAKEFAQHGFMRRIKSMARSITNVFTLLPPDFEGVPDSDVRHDAEINIQAFLFNTFAATDNLAWVWVAEKNIKKPDGTDLPYGQVGLRKERVLASFSSDFRAYLQTREAWFDHLEEFRHALAHRIPLYIPPYMIDPKNEEAYHQLQASMNAALLGGDLARYEQKKAEQKTLAFFRPWMTHSFSENAKKIVFHSQLLADFNTIDEMAWKMLAELDRKQCAAT